MKKILRNTVAALLLLFLTINISTAQGVERQVYKKRVVVNKPGTPSMQFHMRTPVKRGHVWIDGYYKWNKRTRSYVWVKGHQIRIKKGKVWFSGKWRRVPGGWTYIPGFWA